MRKKVFQHAGALIIAAIILTFFTMSWAMYNNTALLEMSQVFSMPFLKKVRYLFIPAVHPYLVSSCRTALGMSWKSGVAAEVIGIPKASIGEQLYYTKLYLDTSGLFAWTFSIILISAVFEFVFLTLLKKVRH